MSISNLAINSNQKIKNYVETGFPVGNSSLKKLKYESRVEAENVLASYSLDTVAQSPVSTNSLDEDIGNRFDYSAVNADVLAKYLAAQLRRAAKLEGRLEHKKEIVKVLLKLGFEEQADKLRRCNANVSVLVCGEGHSFNKYVDYRCHLPVCADCQETKSLRELARILPKFLQVLRDNQHLILAFMTLTLRSNKKRGLRQGCAQIKKNFSTLRGRQVWKKGNKCVAGVGRIENTFNRKLGWHPHIHNLLLLNDYLPQAELSDAWHEITNDSMVVDIREVYDLKAGLIECVKYPFKLSDVRSFSREQFKEMFELKGERLGISFGKFYGLDVDKDIDADLDDEHTEFVKETKKLAIGDACPFCQTRLDLVDFDARNYARFLLSIPVPPNARGKPN
jgi:hypothetical protein